MEPYKIKTVEMIKNTTVEERKEILKKADYNLFNIKAEDVLIDLLTDSGTSALSAQQWSAMMLADESYAGASSYFKFDSAVKKITQHKFIFPTHQGRAAERIVFSILGGKGTYCVANSFFDTTRGNIESTGATAVDLLDDCAPLTSYAPFKGNISISALKEFIHSKGKENIPLVVLTITNNSAGGQPVSMENIEQVSKICKENGIMFFFDACRFAENAYFIKTREKGYKNKSILEICNKMFSYVDGTTMSAKKDGLSNSGGWISLKDAELEEKCRNLLILTEGFTTYGGMTGRELESVAQGLEEVIDENYLQHRIESIAYLGELLRNQGVPIVEPPGGHAVYIDGAKFAPHVPQHQFPAHALACQIYIEGGVRTCEIGSVMFGKEDSQGKPIFHNVELLRLAIPRRLYTLNQLNYVANIIGNVYKDRHMIVGLDFTYSPKVLRHFSSKFKPHQSSSNRTDERRTSEIDFSEFMKLDISESAISSSKIKCEG